ncbi:MAG: exosome complex protein Rrp42 [Candidatus Nanoarchaeia archaeon]|nr:exosome complex protein Rrp42 [Candidatus Nanoarchaeia archaeon]
MNEDSKKFILELAKDNKRNYGSRGLDDFRNLIIEANVSKNAQGSAKVMLGKTIVIAGVKMEIGTPYPDTPNQGNLICSGEMNAIADNEFEPGRPGEDAIELSRVVDRGIRESGAIDFEKLCIAPGEKAWNVLVDFYILNNDGNLIDACGIAAIAALKLARMPKVDEEGKIIHGEWSEQKVPFIKTPIPTTFFKIGDKIFADADKEEQEASEARLTVTTSSNEINALQKGGSGAFTIKEIEECLAKSFKIKDKIVDVISKIK